jgi:hypothetical protein
VAISGLVLRKLWVENRIPEDRYKGIIVPVYKKGNKSVETTEELYCCAKHSKCIKEY